MSIAQNLSSINSTIPAHVQLVSVSKTKPEELLLEAYEAGVRHFGENRVQELVEKHASLPKDIKWHMIGHLQSKKVKQIVEFVHLIHGVDSEKLLETINRRAELVNRKVNCLIQVHIAKESSKFGFDANELEILFQKDLQAEYPFVSVDGLMGMATFTEDMQQVRSEFASLKLLFDKYSKNFYAGILSMGMSGDYKIAIEEGSNMVRIGSSIFGSRN